MSSRQERRQKQHELSVAASKLKKPKPALFPDDVVRRIEAAKLVEGMLRVWQAKGWPKVPFDEFTRAHLLIFSLARTLTHVLLARQRIETAAEAIDRIPPRVFDDGEEMLLLCWRAALFLRALDPYAEFVGVLGDLEDRRADGRDEVITALQKRIDEDRAKAAEVTE